MAEFQDCVATKRIPEKKFQTFLDRIKFQFKSISEKQAFW